MEVMNDDVNLSLFCRNMCITNRGFFLAFRAKKLLDSVILHEKEQFFHCHKHCVEGYENSFVYIY